MQTNGARLAVIGAGIGGTTVAALLQRAGYRCTVFEQTPEFRRLGAGINFAPNGVRVFHALGLGEKMLQVGIHPTTKSNRRADTGEVFYAFDNPALEKKYGAEFMAFHRADLHEMLLSAADPDEFQLGKGLTRIEQSGRSVKIYFEDGTDAEFDAVIGADGLHSQVREYIQGPEEPQYFGHVAYRSIVPRSELEGKIQLNDYIRWWGPDDRYVLMYHMDENRKEFNIVASGAEALGGEYSPASVPPSHMRRYFEEFHADAQCVLDLCEHVIRWPMMIRPPRRPWSKGRVTILGDAAHPMTPHLGQGGGMALEDAVMLARCIEAVGAADIERAFRIYEDNRFERTARVQKASQENKIGCGEGDPQWLFEYDIFSAPIRGISQPA